MKTKIINNYAIFVALEALSISFFFATYQLFLVEKGLSLLEINLLNGGFMLATFLFEIPTGAVADLFGRKRSVIIGLWLFVLSFLIYFFSENFWQFLMAEIIGALAATCISGAMEALVVDSLNNAGQENSEHELFRKGEIKTIGTVVGVMIGSYVARFGLAWPWLLSASAFSVLSFLAIFLLPKDEEEKKIDLKNLRFRFDISPLKKIVKESLDYGFRNKRLMTMISFFAIFSFVIVPINMYWPILLKNDFALPTEFMGLVFAGVSLSIYAGAQFSKLWQTKIKCEKNAIFFSQIVTFLGIIACLLVSNLSLFLIFFLLHEAGRGLLNPLYKAYLNQSIKHKNRATVLSFESMISKAAAGIGLIISGLIADRFGIRASWLFSAFFLFLGIAWFYKNKTD